MDNFPKRIFLNVGFEIEDVHGTKVSYTDLSDVTWSSDRIYGADEEYINKTIAVKFLNRRKKHVDEEIELAPKKNKAALEAVKKELETLLKYL